MNGNGHFFSNLLYWFKKLELVNLELSLQTFPVKGQILNMLDFQCYMVFFGHCSNLLLKHKSRHKQYSKQRVWPPLLNFFTKNGCKQDLISRDLINQPLKMMRAVWTINLNIILLIFTSSSFHDIQAYWTETIHSNFLPDRNTNIQTEATWSV